MRSLRMKVLLPIAAVLLLTSLGLLLKIQNPDFPIPSSLLAVILILFAFLPLGLLLNRVPARVLSRWMLPWNKLQAKLHKLPENRQVTIVILTAASAGLCYGLLQSWMQVAVEQGQVLSGIVRYPLDNAFYIYQVRAWNLWAQIAALGLRLGLSEIFMSVVLSALAGSLLNVGLALLIFAITKEPLIAVTGAFFSILVLYILRLTGFGGFSYPIVLVASAHTYGMLGLFFMLVCVGVLAVGRYRWGFFLLGLSVAAHPSLAIWTGLTVLVCILIEYSRIRDWIRYLPYGLLGLAISTASYLIQKVSYPILVVDPLAQQKYLPAYLKYWDVHRFAPLTNIVSTSLGILLLINFIVVSSTIFAQKDSYTEGSRFIGRFMTISIIMALIFSAWSQSMLPFTNVITVLLPSRFLNLAVFLYAAALIGLMRLYRNEVWVTHIVVLTILLLMLTAALPGLPQSLPDFPSLIIAPVALIRKLSVPHKKVVGPVVLLVMLIPFFRMMTEMNNFPIWAGVAVLTAALWVFLLRSDLTLAPDETFYRIPRRALVFFASMVLLAILVGVSYGQFRGGQMSFKHTYAVDPFWSEVEQGDGLLLTGSSEFYMSQLKGRRPVLIEVGGLDSLPYGIEGAPQVALLLKEVYGIDFFDPPVAARHQGALPNLPQVKALWESRSSAEWKRLAHRFGFSDILVRGDWELQLPVKARSSYMLLYQVP